MKMFIVETHDSKKNALFSHFFPDSAKTTSSIVKTPENVNSPPLQPKNIDPTNVAPTTTSVQQNNLQQQLQTTSQQQANTTPTTTNNNSPQTQQSPCSNPQSSPLMPQSPFQAPSTFFPSPHQVHPQMSPQVQSPFMPNHKSPQVQQQTLPSPHFHHQPSPMQHQTSPLYPHASPQAPPNQVQSAAYVSPSSAEGPKKVLEELLQGSPAPHQTHEPDMPILETSTTTRKIRESLDSHEDELLEDLATYGEELDKGVDESVVNLANDLIGKIEEQEFSDDDMEDNNSNYKVNKTSSASNKSEDQDNRSTKSDEDLDLDLHLSEDDEITENIMNEALPDVALPDIPETQIVTIADDHSDASSSSSSAEEEVEFKCEICASEFATATSLKIHRLKCVKSQQQKKQNKIEIFSCEFCMDEFRSETSLKMHKLICTKKKSEKAQDDPTGEKSPC